MIERNRLAEAAAGYGIELTGQMLDQLQRYAALLEEWNQKINLTAITKPQEVEEKHFLDSLLLAKALPKGPGKLVDVGSGAGFPGLVVKIFRPRQPVTLMEPTGKRVSFLRLVADELGLDGVELVKERAEEAARKSWRESYALATARAVAALPALAEYCLPLVQPGGLFIAMKGAGAAAELEQAARAIEKLGGGEPTQQSYTLPGGDARCLITIKKLAATPPQYPRAGGVIAKRPL